MILYLCKKRFDTCTVACNFTDELTVQDHQDFRNYKLFSKIDLEKNTMYFTILKRMPAFHVY